MKNARKSVIDSVRVSVNRSVYGSVRDSVSDSVHGSAVWYASKSVDLVSHGVNLKL